MSASEGGYRNGLHKSYYVIHRMGDKGAVGTAQEPTAGAPPNRKPHSPSGLFRGAACRDMFRRLVMAALSTIVRRFADRPLATVGAGVGIQAAEQLGQGLQARQV